MDDVGNDFAIVTLKGQDGHDRVKRSPRVLTEHHAAVGTQLAAVDADIAVNRSYAQASILASEPRVFGSLDRTRDQGVFDVLGVNLTPAGGVRCIGTGVRMNG